MDRAQAKWQRDGHGRQRWDQTESYSETRLISRRWPHQGLVDIAETATTRKTSAFRGGGGSEDDLYSSKIDQVDSRCSAA